MIHRLPIRPRDTLLDYWRATTRQVVTMFNDFVGKTAYILMMGNNERCRQFDLLHKTTEDRE